MAIQIAKSIIIKRVNNQIAFNIMDPKDPKNL